MYPPLIKGCRTLVGQHAHWALHCTAVLSGCWIHVACFYHIDRGCSNSCAESCSRDIIRNKNSIKQNMMKLIFFHRLFYTGKLRHHEILHHIGIPLKVDWLMHYIFNWKDWLRTKQNFNQDSKWPAWHFNQKFPKYKSEVVLSELISCSVVRCFTVKCTFVTAM